MGAVDWDFVEDVLDRVFGSYRVTGIIDIDDDGLEVLVGVEVDDIDNMRSIDIYRDEFTGNWMAVYDGYKYYFRDFIDVIEFIAKKLGGI